jgi:hypothetical protein
MAKRSFTPPKYEETLHLLFEKKTGKVIATERRWALVEATPTKTLHASSDVLDRVISGLGRRASDFDVLVLGGAEALKAPVTRVDVRRRIPVRRDIRRWMATAAYPSRIEGP